MGTIITITAGSDVVVITGDGAYIGCTYDVFDGWYDLPNVDMGFVKRPGAPGAFAPAQTFPDEAIVSIEGQYFGPDRAASLAMRENIMALYNNGKPVTVTVADDLRTTSREVMIEAVRFPWTIHKEFSFTIDGRAADSRRYGASVRVSTGLAVAGTGLSYPLVYPLDYGTLAMDGRVPVANEGRTETVSTYTVSDGEMLDGFVIVNVDTGERLTYIGPVTLGTSVVVDTRTRAAFINGTAPAGRFLSSPQWWAIPPRSARSIQFLARGPVTGAPRLYIDTAPAF